MNTQRKVILYIAMSLDGYIAKPDDDISFLSMVEQQGQDYGYAAFTAETDTVIWGRRTYDKVLSFGIEMPHGDKQVFVITRTPRSPKGNIIFYTGNIRQLIEQLKTKQGKHIYIDGGAELVNELLKENLIDEFYISVLPVLLGEGIALFKPGRSETKLKLLAATSFEKGLVQLHYIRNN